MPQYLVFRFDVTSLTETQRSLLSLHVQAQAEASAYDGHLHDEHDKPIEENPNYPDVEVSEVCPWCHAELVGGECGGEGEGICTERACVEDYDPKGLIVEAYVRDFCSERDIENTLVPYRDDGLTYFDQLAFLICEYHGLTNSWTDIKRSRRLP